MVGDSSPLMGQLRSQGYTISEYRNDEFLQVFALTKNKESHYLYILNSLEISPSGEQKALTLIYNQGNLTQAEIEVLALNPPAPNN